MAVYLGNHTRPHIQKGPTLSLMLYCHYADIHINFIFEHVFWKWSKCVRKADMDGENTEHVCKQWRYCTVPCYPSHVELAQSLIGVNAAAVQWLHVGFSETKASIKGVCCL